MLYYTIRYTKTIHQDHKFGKGSAAFPGDPVSLIREAFCYELVR